MQNKMVDKSRIMEEKAAKKIDQIVNKTYLHELQNSKLSPLAPESERQVIEESICLFPVTQYTFDREENNIRKLAGVYTGAAAAEASPVMIIRGYASGFTEIYMGVCGEKSRINGAYPKIKVLREGLIGQFPGMRANGDAILPNDRLRRTINSCFDPDYKAVAAVSCIASVNDSGRDGEFRQGIEKLIEAMNGRDYTFLVISQYLPNNLLDKMKCEMEELYENLFPFRSANITVGEQFASSVSDTFSQSVSNGINSSVSASLSAGTNSYTSESKSVSTTYRSGQTFMGNAFDISRGENNGEARGESFSHQSSENRTKGENYQFSEGKTLGRTQSNTSVFSVQYNTENKKVSEILKNIDCQLARLKSGRGSGMFAVAAYCLAPSSVEARVGACSYKAIVSGENTNLESNGINVWTGEDYRHIVEYLRQIRHPEFRLSEQLEDCAEIIVTPATFVTSNELAVHMPLPQRKVNGILVQESVSFGRNIHSLDRSWEQKEKLLIGHIHHLGHTEQSEALLLRDSLTMHTFITGTTGSGKSNALYGIITQLASPDSGIHFLVIEPAKGDYKEVFAQREDVDVYGVNPYKTPLLRIDPFRFPEDIHILEHLDRLMDIFLVCWPLYAAMPAVLKEAIISAYEDAGWNMRTSGNRYGIRIYPTFLDVMKKVERNIQMSQYSSETKGDYIGSLCTRLKDLTDGIAGMIFTSDCIPDEMLFERNVIVDLSRLGSAETKSLIMGMLVMKLQEYRLSSSKKLDGKLKHITVLEEAHHLLKRPDMISGGSGESSGVAAHAVEMLTNAIAEMRASGEGFIIADQAPEMMDKSVIRNTNTKIILRLPEESDRETVGKSVGLTASQINEITKLQCGVAVVYQNDWADAVLVKIPYYPVADCSYQYTPDEIFGEDDRIESGLFKALMYSVVLISSNNDMQRTCGIDRWLRDGGLEKLEKLNLSSGIKSRLYEFQSVSSGDQKDRDAERKKHLGTLAWEFFNTQEVFSKVGCKPYDDMSVWRERFVSYLKPSVTDYPARCIDLLIMVLIREQIHQTADGSSLYRAYNDWLQKQIGEKTRTEEGNIEGQ